MDRKISGTMQDDINEPIEIAQIAMEDSMSTSEGTGYHPRRKNFSQYAQRYYRAYCGRLPRSTRWPCEHFRLPDDHRQPWEKNMLAPLRRRSLGQPRRYSSDNGEIVIINIRRSLRNAVDLVKSLNPLVKTPGRYPKVPAGMR